MDIQILESWLKEYLDTKADSKQFAKYLSLSGPTVDRTHKFAETDKLFEIEVTSNRVDAMSIYGIAREAAAILPRYGFESKLKSLNVYGGDIPDDGLELTLKPDKDLTYRIMGVVIEDIQNWETPEWMKTRLESAGIRSKNAVVDITNYVMHEVGHPCHAFDYDKIPNKKIVVRESKKGERVTSFDGKEYELSGGDIVFDDGDGNIIDLPGIIGTQNSVVTDDTKRVLFFFDTNSAKHIRKTSMELAIRTNAAVLNEKGVDPELAEVAMLRGLLLFQDICNAKIASPIYDSYPAKPKPKSITVQKEFIKSILDVDISNSEVIEILTSLGFEVKNNKDDFVIDIPTFRVLDITNKESVVEEIARVYGYHNLPSKIMSTALPKSKTDPVFADESRIKNEIVKLGGSEVYTFSLVSKQMAGDSGLRLVNPLGADTEYLRTSMLPSMKLAMSENKSIESLHLFEISSVYKKSKDTLPEQEFMLAGIFKGYEYRKAKSILESLLNQLNIKFKVELNNNDKYINNSSVKFVNKDKKVIEMGILDNDLIYYEGKLEIIRELMSAYPQFDPIPEFPPQIEDITIEIKNKSVGEMFNYLKSADKHIYRVELSDIYEDNYTFRIYYLAEDRTLTDREVEEIRNNILKNI